MDWRRAVVSDFGLALVLTNCGLQPTLVENCASDSGGYRPRGSALQIGWITASESEVETDDHLSDLLLSSQQGRQLLRLGSAWIELDAGAQDLLLTHHCRGSAGPICLSTDIRSSPSGRTSRGWLPPSWMRPGR